MNAKTKTKKEKNASSSPKKAFNNSNNDSNNNNNYNDNATIEEKSSSSQITKLSPATKHTSSSDMSKLSQKTEATSQETNFSLTASIQKRDLKVSTKTISGKKKEGKGKTVTWKKDVEVVEIASYKEYNQSANIDTVVAKPKTETGCKCTIF